MKDSFIRSFLLQMVQEKHGDEAELEFIEKEVERLSYDLQEKLVAYFEPQMDSTSRAEFERLLNEGEDMNSTGQFLFGAIADLENKTIEFLDKYKSEYLNTTTD
ncbi:hypothetical protein JW978_02405 [Candidatus Dojkabacteria bacterium]|nr:hypothetical protein [Candidatus Dojkabacteria bacterium]